MWSYCFDIYILQHRFCSTPLGSRQFSEMANLHLAFVSALLMRVFLVCLLSKVIPRYIALSVCCSSVSSYIIFMGFDLVDKVKSVVNDLVLFIFTHHSCAQLARMLVASWSRILAYSSGLHRTRSSVYIAHFTENGKFLDKGHWSVMNSKKSVGDMSPPCGTPCLRSIFLLFVLCMTTLARRLCRYDLIHRNIFRVMLHFFSFRSRPSAQTVSIAFCRSIHTVSVSFLCWNRSSISCAGYVV